MPNPALKPRTAGLRFSVLDAAVLLVFGLSAVGLATLGSELWWLLLIVAGHFFLFCNVFRVRRRFELIWAAVLLLNAGTWLWLDRLTWLAVLACQLPITAVLIVAEMRMARYHGILARRLNRRLDDYLEGRIP
jgi:hypothetical protein